MITRPPSEIELSEQSASDHSRLERDRIARGEAQERLDQQRQEVSEAKEWTAAHDRLTAKIRAEQLELIAAEVAAGEATEQLLTRYAQVDRPAGLEKANRELWESRAKVTEDLKSIGFTPGPVDKGSRLGPMQFDVVSSHPAVIAAARKARHRRGV